MSARSTIDRQIAALAEIIVKQASEDGVELDVRVDAFKALTAYGLGMKKVREKDDKPDPDAANFGNFTNKLSAVK